MEKLYSCFQTTMSHGFSWAVKMYLVTVSLLVLFIWWRAETSLEFQRRKEEGKFQKPNFWVHLKKNCIQDTFAIFLGATRDHSRIDFNLLKIYQIENYINFFQYVSCFFSLRSSDTIRRQDVRPHNSFKLHMLQLEC